METDFETMDDPPIGLLIRHQLQRSQDSGAITDWSSGSGSPTRRSCKSEESFSCLSTGIPSSLSSTASYSPSNKFVTILSINSHSEESENLAKAQQDEQQQEPGLGNHPIQIDIKSQPADAGFVTVLTIGGDGKEETRPPGSVAKPHEDESEDKLAPRFVEEIVEVWRLPGEKLGFGLKFDGGLQKGQNVKRLFIQCCSENSPASKIRASWGQLVEMDEIMAINDRRVHDMFRAEIVGELTNGPIALRLLIRHYYRQLDHDLVPSGLAEKSKTHLTTSFPAHEPNTAPAVVTPSHRKTPCHPQERAVDVPEEFLNSNYNTVAKKSTLFPTLPEEPIYDTVTEEKDDEKSPQNPPVPPPRRRRECRRLSQDSVSSSVGHTSLMSFKSVSIPKPPRTKLPLVASRSLEGFLRQDPSSANNALTFSQVNPPQLAKVEDKEKTSQGKKSKKNKLFRLFQNMHGNRHTGVTKENVSVISPRAVEPLPSTIVTTASTFPENVRGPPDALIDQNFDLQQIENDVQEQTAVTSTPKTQRPPTVAPVCRTESSSSTTSICSSVSSHLLPPPPGVYTDLVAEEDAMLNALESEFSDAETGSSVTTVVERSGKGGSSTASSLTPSSFPSSANEFAFEDLDAETIRICEQNLEGTEFLRELLREHGGSFEVPDFQLHTFPIAKSSLSEVELLLDIEPPENFQDGDGDNRPHQEISEVPQAFTEDSGFQSITTESAQVHASVDVTDNFDVAQQVGGKATWKRNSVGIQEADTDSQKPSELGSITVEQVNEPRSEEVKKEDAEISARSMPQQCTRPASAASIPQPSATKKVPTIINEAAVITRRVPPLAAPRQKSLLPNPEGCQPCVVVNADAAVANAPTVTEADLPAGLSPAPCESEHGRENDAETLAFADWIADQREADLATDALNLHEDAAALLVGMNTTQEHALTATLDEIRDGAGLQADMMLLSAPEMKDESDLPHVGSPSGEASVVTTSGEAERAIGTNKNVHTGKTRIPFPMMPAARVTGVLVKQDAGTGTPTAVRHLAKMTSSPARMISPTTNDLRGHKPAGTVPSNAAKLAVTTSGQVVKSNPTTRIVMSSNKSKLRKSATPTLKSAHSEGNLLENATLSRDDALTREDDHNNTTAQRRATRTKSVDQLHVKDGSVTDESGSDNTPIVLQTSAPMNPEKGVKMGAAPFSSVTGPVERLPHVKGVPVTSTSRHNRTVTAVTVRKSRIPTMAKNAHTAQRTQSLLSLTLPGQAAQGEKDNTSVGPANSSSLVTLTGENKKTRSGGAGELKYPNKKHGSSSQLHATRVPQQQQSSIPLTRLPVARTITTSNSHSKLVARKSALGGTRAASLNNLSKRAAKRSVSVPEIVAKSGAEVVDLCDPTLDGSVSVHAPTSSALLAGASSMDVSSSLRNPSLHGSLHSRLPPDGHEFPMAYDEPHSPLSKTKNHQDKAPVPRLRSTTMPSPRKTNNESNGDNSKGTAKHLWRRDERSEKSVRDKIALFTSDDQNPKLVTTNAKTAVFGKPSTGVAATTISHEETCRSVSTLPRNRGIRESGSAPGEEECWSNKNLSYSVDNLAVSCSTKSNSSHSKKSSLEQRPHPNPKPAATITMATSHNNSASSLYSPHATLMERSRSLMDVSKRRSVGGTTIPVPKTSLQHHHNVNNVNLIPRKVSLSALMEQRRQSMSKLRGLVIPDIGEPENTLAAASSGMISPNKPIQLPEIISKDSVLAQSKIPVPRELRHAQSTPGLYDVTDSSAPRHKPPGSNHNTVLTTPPWKTSTSALPKYSPAFKRKELTVYAGTNTRSGTDATTATTTATDVNRHESESRDSLEESSDTDADSAVSSSRSSFSPPGSPVLDLDSARVLKPHTVEALNRKNVLQSARFSSGAGSGVLSESNLSSKAPLSAASSHPVVGEIPVDRSSIARQSSEIEVKTAVVTEVFDPEEPVSTPAIESEQEIPEATPRKSAPTPNLVKVVEEPAAMETRFKATSTKNRSETTTTTTLEKTEKKDGVAGPKNFRALAERWEQRSQDSSAPAVVTASSPSGNMPPKQQTVVNLRKKDATSPVEEVWPFYGESSESELSHSGSREMLDISNKALQQRPDVKPRRSLAIHEIRQSFERAEQLLSNGREEERMEPATSSTETTMSPPRLMGNRKDVEVVPHAIFNTALPSQPQLTSHARLSSLDSMTSDESGLQFANTYGYLAGMSSGGTLRDNFGSITSLASSTSLISPQELQQLLEEANQSLEESGTPSHEIVVVVLHRGEGSLGVTSASLGLGITLAGGADYETKEITVHKVISGSLADRDGRIKKGDRVLSINGKSLKGVTHREALTILKTPRPEVVLVLSRSRSVTPQSQEPLEDSTSFGSQAGSNQSNVKLSSSLVSSRPPRILESPMDSQSLASDGIEEDSLRGPVITTCLCKDGAGLGFSLEGGKDSPLGDRPLTVKKIFTGGAACKNDVLRVGDQILSVNGIDVTCMSRIEAWNLMKKLPDGTVSLRIRQLLKNA